MSTHQRRAGEDTTAQNHYALNQNYIRHLFYRLKIYIKLLVYLENILSPLTVKFQIIMIFYALKRYSSKLSTFVTIRLESIMTFEPVFQIQNKSRNEIVAAIRAAEQKIPGLVFNYPPIAIWNYVDEPSLTPEDLWDGTNRYSNNLYIHIPFCRQKCSFCYYSVVPGAKNEMIDDYLDCLEREAEMFASSIHAETKFDTLFIGGGTPGLLSPQQLDRLMTRVVKRFNVADVYESNLEFSPDTITREKIDVARSHGTNRISMGVQSFDEQILRMARRDETDPKRVIDQYYILANSGIETINLDFIAGVEKSDDESMKRTLDTLFQLDRWPNQLALFTLSVRKGTINAKYIKDSPEDLFDRSLKIYRYAQDRILDNGYWQYSRNLFSTGNNIFRYQDNVWGRNGYVLAIGASGYSHSHKGVYQNIYDTKKYMSTIKEGRLPIEKMYLLSEEEQTRRHLVLAMKHTTLNRNEFNAFYNNGEEMLSRFESELDAMIECGIVGRENGKIVYSREGIAVADRYVRLFYSPNVNDAIMGINYGKKTRDPFNFTV